MAEIEYRWLSLDEIGEYSSVSSHTVCHWVDKHTMPVHLMSHIGKFKKDKVDTWVEFRDAPDLKSKGAGH